MTIENTTKTRLKQVLFYGIALLLIGLLYGLFVNKTGLAVPCLFHLITGLKCPGCGVTRMCVALLQFDFRNAFNSHPMLLLQLPFLVVILMRNLIGYIKSGRCRITRSETAVIYIFIILLLAFTVYRNIMKI